MSFITDTLMDRFYRYLGKIKTPGHALVVSGMLAGFCSLLSVIGTRFILADTEASVWPYLSLLAYGMPFLMVLASSFLLIRAFSHLNRRNKLLSEVADRDGLTRLANRTAFTRRGRQMISQARLHQMPLSMIMIDVDHFKTINDRFGHLAGDLALQHLAGVLNSSCRELDLPSRWGGEEFAILLRSANIDGARHFADRVRKSVANAPLYWDGETISLTLSAGVSEFDPEHDDFDDMVKRADKALYVAKSCGRNQVRQSHSCPDVVEGLEQDVEFYEANVA